MFLCIFKFAQKLNGNAKIKKTTTVIQFTKLFWVHIMFKLHPCDFRWLEAMEKAIHPITQVISLYFYIQIYMYVHTVFLPNLQLFILCYNVYFQHYLYLHLHFYLHCLAASCSLYASVFISQCSYCPYSIHLCIFMLRFIHACVLHEVDYKHSVV